MTKTDESPLASYLKPAGPFFVRAGVLSIFANLFLLTGPIYMLQVYDRVLASGSFGTLIVVSLLAFALYVGSAALDFARAGLLSRGAKIFEDGAEDRVVDAAVRLGRDHGSTRGEEPISDLRALRQFLASPIVQSVFDAPWAPFFLVLIFLMHPALGLLALLGMAWLALLAMANEHATKRSLYESYGLQSRATRLIQNLLRNSGAVLAMGFGDDVKRRIQNLTSGASSATARSIEINALYSSMTKSSRLGLQSAILGVGAMLAILQEITPGVMIAASILFGRAMAPVEQLVGQWRGFSNAARSRRRLERVLEDYPAEPSHMPLPAPASSVEVEGLFVRPFGAARPIISDVSFSIAKGEIIGLLGPSGAGKSVLARALVGAENAQAGEVRLGGAALPKWAPGDLGRHIGFLPQEVELLDGTVAQNIARFAPDATPDEIIAAAKAAGAHELFLALPNAYDTEIGEGENPLSAGQRQRVGLARALFRDPTFVVLDEPNAHLDADGERALSDALLSLKARGACVVVISHRAGALREADRLMTLMNGRVFAYGPRDKILPMLLPARAAGL